MAQRGTLIGAIQGGGTKFVCMVGTDPLAPLARRLVPTGDPAGTLVACRQFLDAAAAEHGPLAALGIGCFGPLQLHAEARDHGQVLATPKPGWTGADLLAPFRSLAMPLVLDTDVGAAARGELALGSGRGLASIAYVTVGTGIGGAIAPAAPGERRMHAEMGHLPVRRDPLDVQFAGVCPFHRDCLEGLASGVAIQARWGCTLAQLPTGHPGRALIAGYLGQLAAAIALLHAPEAIVFGGGVMTDGLLLPLLRESLGRWLGEYLPLLRTPAQREAYVRAAGLGDDSTLVGAALLARAALGDVRTAP